MKVAVFDVNYNETGVIDLNDETFGVSPRRDILSRVVRWQLAKRRAGTHQTKTISVVSGSGKKIVRQKGSGGARHGSRRAAQFRGGGIVFGPTTRGYEFSLQKKIRRLGLRMAISDKIKDGNFAVLSDLSLKSPKTSAFIEPFEKKGVRSVLFVDDVPNENVVLAVRNKNGYDFIPQIGLNVYDVLRRDYLMITKAAVESLDARLRS
jgi:large subunit ribosomal protein L4